MKLKKIPLNMFVYFVVSIFVVSYSYGQQNDIDLILNTEWTLTTLTVNGDTITPPNNDEVQFVTLYFDPGSDDELPFYFTTVCDQEIGRPEFLTVNENPAIFLDGDPESLIVCQLDQNVNFNEIYFDFLGNSTDDTFLYELPIINEFIHLELTSSNGNKALYNSNVLSVKEKEKLNLLLYPNPVKDILNLTIANDIIYSISLYTIKGELMRRFENERNINLGFLKQGIYLIKIVDTSGNQTVTKIIKQ